MSWLNDRLPLFRTDLGGLRNSGSSSRAVLRVVRPVCVGYFGSLGAELPTLKSSSSKKSESESELRTASWPFDKTRLLAREFAEVCDVVGGSVSIDVMTVSSAVGASSTVEAFDPKDTAGPGADLCARSGSAVLLVLGMGGCTTSLLAVCALAV